MTFLIRRDPKGEMSKYLYSLPVGAKLEVRGPKTEFRIPSDVNHLVFIAGGTGIAPALQAAEVLLSRKGGDDATERLTVHILWANRRREDCIGATTSSNAGWLSSLINRFSASRPAVHTTSTETPNPVVRDLSRLQSENPGRVTVDYFIDDENTFINQHIVNRTLHNIRASSNQPSTKSPGPVQIIVSGPDGFIGHIAGPKVLSYSATRPGQTETDLAASQGPVGGLLHQAGATREKGFRVFKL